MNSFFVYFYLLKYLCVSCVCACFFPLSMCIARIFSVRSSFIFSVFPVFDLVFAVVAFFFVFIHSIRVDFVRCALCVYSQATRLHSFQARIYLIHSNRFSYMLFILNLNPKCTANGERKAWTFINISTGDVEYSSVFFLSCVWIFGVCVTRATSFFSISLSFYRWVAICYWLCMREGDSFFNCSFIVTIHNCCYFLLAFFHIFFIDSHGQWSNRILVCMIELRAIR